MIEMSIESPKFGIEILHDEHDRFVSRQGFGDNNSAKEAKLISGI